MSGRLRATATNAESNVTKTSSAGHFRRRHTARGISRLEIVRTAFCLLSGSMDSGKPTASGPGRVAILTPHASFYPFAWLFVGHGQAIAHAVSSRHGTRHA